LFATPSSKLKQFTSSRLAQRYSELTNERRTLQAEAAALQAERDRLEQGEDAVPPLSPYRGPDARADRAGAPFWQLVDFRDHVNEAQRASLEAALEASALLDAWVTPDGRLQILDGEQLHDTQLLERPHRTASLAAWLQPAGTFDAAVVVRLLEGMVCTPIDDGTAETWVSPDGRFRIGALAGAWNKPVATYVGYAARAAARARRLEAITLRMDQLGQELVQVEDRLAEHRGNLSLQMILQHFAFSGREQFAPLCDLLMQMVYELIGTFGTILVHDGDDEAIVGLLHLSLLAQRCKGLPEFGVVLRQLTLDAGRAGARVQDRGSRRTSRRGQ
jgi:hypothetical protein